LRARPNSSGTKLPFAKHWTRTLDRWFEQGVDTPGLVLLKVHAKSAFYWDGEEEGEVLIDREAFVGGP
jgi:general stress protein 26